jgi:large subunit ribosomal protein L4
LQGVEEVIEGGGEIIMSKLPIYNMKGDRVGEYDIADELLELKKGAQAVHDAVEAYQTGLRAGTASTKTRAHVSGGGIKPWRQKGTGRARAGSIRSPIWRGGGIVFGPHPKKYEKCVNKKILRLAFRRAFSEKVASGDVALMDRLSLSAPKTKSIVSVLNKLKIERGVLLVLDLPDKNVQLASRNIPNVEVVTAVGVHTYQLLRYPRMLVSQDAMAKLEERLKKPAGRAS